MKKQNQKNPTTEYEQALICSKNAKQKNKENESQWADCSERLNARVKKRKVKNICSMYLLSTHLKTVSEILTLLWEETHLSLASGRAGFHLLVFALSEILSTECKDVIRFTRKQDYRFRKIWSSVEIK